MFSGTKFRFWSRQSSSKKDAEKESSKNKSKNASSPKGEDEGCRQPNTRQDKFNLQKLQEDYARLEDAVEELTPYRTKAFALEKKLVYITKSFERKQNRYLAAIASLEAENEQLQEELRRMKSICGSCYFCSRHQLMVVHPEAGKHFQSSRRNDLQGSSESVESSKSFRRLQKLEDEQSAIVQETSRQKQETSRCLEQISSEVMKALVSQKVLRRDCTQLQCRILQLEKQNSQLNEVIFRHYPPYHSQTKFLMGQRNENVSAYHPQIQLHSPWDEHSLASNSAMETIEYEEKTTSQRLFRYPSNQRFDAEVCRPTSDYLSYSYIPEQVAVNSTSAANMSRNHDSQIAPFHKDVSRVDSVSKNAKDSLGDLYLDVRNEGKDARNWNLSTSSTLTLRDETANGENDSQCKNSFSRGSTFSLNDILDGDHDDLQLSIQEGTKNNDSAGNTDNNNRPWYAIEPVHHQKDLEQKYSKPLMFVGDQKDTSALQIARDISDKTLKEHKELTQVPFSRASNDAESGISFDNCGVKQKTAAEKRHRYSYPAAIPVKSALSSEVHKMHFTQAENSTRVEMAEASKALQTVIETKQAVQKFKLLNFETFFDDRDAEKQGTIQERTVPVTVSQPQISKYEVSRLSAENADAETAINKNPRTSNSVQEDIMHKEFSQSLASDEDREKLNIMQGTILEASKSNQSPERQGLIQRNILHMNLLIETPPDIHVSGRNSLTASPPDSNTLWPNNVHATLNERKSTGDNNLSDQSHALDTIHQNITASEQNKPSHNDYDPDQVVPSEERKQGQNDILEESVNTKADMESMIQKKRERFDSISNEQLTKDLAKDVIMSKDKVMALTAYFEEVHIEQCPDCQQSGTRCRISPAFRHSLGSKENSLSEDDSKRIDECTVIDLDRNQMKKCQDDADETLKTDEYHDQLTNETCTSLISETSNCEDAVTSASVQETQHLTSDDFNVSENVLASDTRFKESMNSRGNTNKATDSQIEGTLLEDEMEEINKTEPEQFRHNIISPAGETKLAKEIENTDDNKDRDLKMRLLGGNNPTATSGEQLMSKSTQWKSLPSVSASDNLLPPFQVQYIRTLSLKSFSDALTPPPSPKFHKENAQNKCLAQAYGLTQECSEDMSNSYAIIQEIQYETQNRHSDRPQGNSQSNKKNHYEKATQDPTEEESQSCLQSSTQVECQSYNQANQFTVFSKDESKAQYVPEWSPLHSQIHSTTQGQFEVYGRDESHFCTQNYPQENLIDDLVYSSHNSPKMNPFPVDEAFKTQLQPINRCPAFSSAEILHDDRQEDLTCSAYPDLLSSSRPKVTMRRSQGSQEVKGRCNVLTEEDIMKYRLDCHENRRTIIGSYPGDLQPNVVSFEAMGSPENDLRIVSTKPPLPPRRFHVTKYYVRDSSNPLLDPRDFFTFENEVLHSTSHADASPTKNEFITEADQSTPIWERERTYPGYSRAIDYNYPASDAMRRQGTERNSLGLDSSTVHHTQLIENKKMGISVSPPQGYQPAVGRQSSGQRNSYPDCSGKDYSQLHAGWDDINIAAAPTSHYPLQQVQTTRPVSFHQGTELTRYGHGFNSSLNAGPVHRKLPTQCQQLESEISQKNSKDTENDFVFSEISKQIENLRQTVSELQKKSTENQ